MKAQSTAISAQLSQWPACVCLTYVVNKHCLSTKNVPNQGFPNYKRLCSQWKVHPVEIPHKHDHGQTLQFLPKSVPDVEIGEGKDKSVAFSTTPVGDRDDGPVEGIRAAMRSFRLVDFCELEL
jgi:hypothetical protein